MTITITINTDNAAFEPEPADEVERILRRLANDVRDIFQDVLEDGFSLRDINGNTVGSVTVTD